MQVPRTPVTGFQRRCGLTRVAADNATGGYGEQEKDRAVALQQNPVSLGVWIHWHAGKEVWMWQAIQYVTGGATLLAFLAAVAASTYRSSANRRERLIRQAHAPERPVLIMAALEALNVKTDGLPEDKKFELALALVQERSERFRTAAIVACIFGLLTAATTAYAIGKAGGESDLALSPIIPDTASDSTEVSKDTSSFRPPRTDTLIERSFVINETNSDHKTLETNTKQYTKIFDADSGYQITSHTWKPSSATRESDLTFNLVGGGSQIRVDFKLKSGPKTDKYRGWLKGNLVTTQRRIHPD